MKNDVEIKCYMYEKIQKRNKIFIFKKISVSSLLTLKQTIITELAYWNPEMDYKININ